MHQYECTILRVVVLLVSMLDIEDILEAYNRWKLREPLPEDAHKKVN